MSCDFSICRQTLFCPVTKQDSCFVFVTVVAGMEWMADPFSHSTNHLSADFS